MQTVASDEKDTLLAKLTSREPRVLGKLISLAENDEAAGRHARELLAA